jgi:hypothetical protein
MNNKILAVISVGATSEGGFDSKSRSQEVDIRHIDYAKCNVFDLCDGDVVNLSLCAWRR